MQRSELKKSANRAFSCRTMGLANSSQAEPIFPSSRGSVVQVRSGHARDGAIVGARHRNGAGK